MTEPRLSIEFSALITTVILYYIVSIYQAFVFLFDFSFVLVRVGLQFGIVGLELIIYLILVALVFRRTVHA